MKKPVLILLAVLSLLLVVIGVCYLGRRGAIVVNGNSKSSAFYLHPPHQPNLQNRRWKNPMPMVGVDRHLPTLLPQVIGGVKNFVFFIGYPRSGHSIVGSILDAHPHIVISHEFMLMNRQAVFSEPWTANWTSDLFNVLYQHSYLDVQNGTRNSGMTEKGYALHIDGLWQGEYDKFIDVIGDKSGGLTTSQYVHDAVKFQHNYKELASRLPVPIKAVHVLRNPYDQITTGLIYALIDDGQFTKMDFTNAKKNLASGTQELKKKFVNETVLCRKINNFFNRRWAASRIIEVVGETNVLTIHSSDLVHNPEDTIRTMCEFFGVNVPDIYLKIASEKVFTSISRTRALTEWPPRMMAEVEEQIKQYKILHRYTFTSD